MKFCRIKILSIMFLLLLVMVIVVLFGDNIKLYITNNIGGIRKKDLVIDNLDISDVAFEVMDSAIDADISNIAVNIERVEVYDGMTKEELSIKINKYLKDKGVLANQGDLIVTQSLLLGVDPYVAVAIMMHETGCNATCSKLVRNKNNVGGMRGRSGKWQSFVTIEDGINGFLSNLSRNYYKKGLDTPEKMAKKYAGGSETWAGKVRNYIKKIEAI